MAGIIKAGADPGSGLDAQHVAFNFDDLNERANNYLGQIRQQARTILEEAKQEAERYREQVIQEARVEARKQIEELVQQQVKAQLAPFIPSWEEATNKIVELRHNWMKEWEEGAVNLACMIAEKVVRHEIKTRPEVVSDLLREAIELVSGATQIEILIHPADLELVESQLNVLTRGLDKTANVSVNVDESIEQGGVKVVTNQGEVDQTIETRLGRIHDELVRFA